MTSGRHWRHMRRDYRKRTRLLVAHMNDPGGGGTARWIPLLKWAGWPAGAIGGAMQIMGRESGGSPHRWNRGGSPCFGFFQIHRCWWGSHGFAWIYRAINQARLAWHIFHDVQHDSWLPAWAATY